MTAQSEMTDTLYGLDTGTAYVYTNKSPSVGGAKRVYYTIDGKFAIARLKKGVDASAFIGNLNEILMFRRALPLKGKQYWERIFIWPIEQLVTNADTLAYVMPVVSSNFYLRPSDYRESDKDRKLKHNEDFFTVLRFHDFKQDVQGTFADYFKMGEHIARAIRFINRWGRSYGDISFNNILVDPPSASVQFIDMDNMTINQASGRSMSGTPGYCAPEIYFDGTKATSKTDDFSLAVMLYKMLHLRHPFLREPYAHDVEAQPTPKRKKESFVYIESENGTNRYTRADVMKGLEKECKTELYLPHCFPWFDLDRLPSRKVVGEKMSELFKKTFEDYLFDPDNRPTAEEWEKQIIRTEGRLLPCANLDCPAGSFILDESNYDCKQNRLVCPFCGTALTEPVFTMSVIDCSDFKRWKWIIATPSSKTRPILRWELGGFDTQNRSKLLGDQLEDADLLEPVAELFYSGNRFSLRNFSGTNLTFKRNKEEKILSDGETIALLKNDVFYKVRDRAFHVLGVIG